MSNRCESCNALTHLDEELDNEEEPVDLHQVEGKQHGIEGKVE